MSIRAVHRLSYLNKLVCVILKIRQCTKLRNIRIQISVRKSDLRDLQPRSYLNRINLETEIRLIEKKYCYHSV
jgi:hypothetical protein